MNKHVNKNKPAKRVDPNLAPVNRDHIPKEVATELLLTSRRLTNPERKRFMDARAIVMTSKRTAKSVEETVAARMQRSTWEQLQTWLRRMNQRRDDSQHRVNRLTKRATKLNEQPKSELRDGQLFLINRALSDAQIRGFAFEQARDAVENEIERRQKFWAELKKVAPSVAKKIENK